MASKFLLSSAALFALVPFGSQAEEVQARGWSVVGGPALGPGVWAFHAQGGWPGFSATALAGMSRGVDLGAVFTFNYGFEGDVNLGLFTKTYRLQWLLRANLLDSGKINLGAYF